MKHLRLIPLVLVLALAFTGGFAPQAEAGICDGPYGCSRDSDCFITCCTTYGCDPSYPPFCDFFPNSTCGVCFC